jgi:hypothetical protein
MGIKYHRFKDKFFLQSCFVKYTKYQNVFEVYVVEFNEVCIYLYQVLYG